MSWATTTATNGSHTLTARARDAAGNATTSAPVTVTVSNTAPPPAGIVAGYAFDDGTGTSAADASGHGFTGTLTNGPTWGAGRYGGAIVLDGADDYVDLGNPTALRLTGSMTVSAWINSSAFPPTTPPIVSKRGSVGFQLDTTVDTGAADHRLQADEQRRRGHDPLRRDGAAAEHLVPRRRRLRRGRGDDARLPERPPRRRRAGRHRDLDPAGLSAERPDRAAGRAAGTEFGGRIDDVRIYNRR